MIFEVLTIGRISVDLYPQGIGLSLSEVKSFDKFLGTSSTNVAVAASRYGYHSAVITRVGDDGLGEYVRVALCRFGVDDIERVMATTTLPCLLLGGDPGDDPDATYAGWQRGL